MSDDLRNHRSRSNTPTKLRISSKSSKGHDKKHRSNRHKRRSRSPSHSSSNSRSRSRSREYIKHKKSKKKSKHKKHKRSRSRSLSTSDSYSSSTYDSSSSSSTDTDYHKKKHRKKSKRKHDKKHKKSKHKSKHCKRKDKKRSRKKKHKKHHKNKDKSCKKVRDKTLLEGNLSIYKPSEYREGEHGFITPNDLINKMPEFTSWLVDIHNVHMDNLGTRDTRKWFAKFCDDWNTSTMVDDKYYDIDKWNKANGGGDNETVDRMDTFGMSDEQRLMTEKRAARQNEQDKRYAARVQEMKKHLIHLKSNDRKGFQSLTDQHIPRKETFQSLAAKRKAKKVEDRVKRFGKYDRNISWD